MFLTGGKALWALDGSVRVVAVVHWSLLGGCSQALVQAIAEWLTGWIRDKSRPRMISSLTCMTYASLQIKSFSTLTSNYLQAKQSYINSSKQWQPWPKSFNFICIWACTLQLPSDWLQPHVGRLICTYEAAQPLLDITIIWPLSTSHA